MALITWTETSVTVNVGDTVTVDFTYGKEYGEYFDTRITTSDTGVATITTSGQYSQFGGTATITGVSAGTATVVPGPRDTQNTPLTITVTAPAPVEDDKFLNKRGLTHFWENIDEIKQDKLIAGTNITIASDNTISASQPTVNDATLTIQKNGTTVKTFTANASTNVTANITVPTKTSDIANDSNFVASGDLATVATSGSYNDLSNKPAIPAKQVFYGTSDSSGGSSNKTVACSGFAYAEGNVIYVTFSNADTYSGDSGMTMNVNATGTKAILTQTTSGGGVQSDYKWAAGETVCFVCHNDYYLMVEAAMATTTTSGLMSVNDKNKLDGIAAGAEANVQANWTESNSSSDAYIQNKPSLATVATSGSYNDLTNKPTVPEIKKRTGASTTTNITPLYVAGDGTTTPMALKTHGDDHTGSFAYVNINEPTSDISEAYIGGYVWDEYEDWWRKMSEVRLALYSDIPTVPTVVQTTGQSTTDVMSQKAVTDIIGNVETILQTLNNGGGAQ